ncbi:MAG: hypothetical protein GY906_40415, partial [bacterium]|nr:hypothetical protein [bacterium]
MPNNESSNRLLRWYLFLLGVVASVASTLILFSPSEHPITSDNQIFFYRAERCASGRPPHTSIVDPRNSLPDLLTASAMVGGRRIGVSDLSASRLVSLSCHVLTAGLIAVFAFTISGSIRAGVLSVVIFLSLFATSRDAVVGNQTKAFVLLFLVAALLMYCRYRPFWAGVFSACSVLSWQPSVVMLLVLGALMWSHEDRWSRVRWFVAGAVLPALAYEGYFLIVGALSTQLEQSIVLPLLFMKGSFRGWVL